MKTTEHSYLRSCANIAIQPISATNAEDHRYFTTQRSEYLISQNSFARSINQGQLTPITRLTNQLDQIYSEET